MSTVLGIDVGGTGIKGAIVDTRSGTLVSDRVKIKTPSPATPNAIISTIGKIVHQLKWQGSLMGIGFPAIIKNNRPQTAINIDNACINYPFVDDIKKRYGIEVTILNDADAAGLAEYKYKIYPTNTTILLITLGTGTGSALIRQGRLVPNIEIGLMRWKGDLLDKYASNKTRKELGLSWEVWGYRLDEVLQHIYDVFSPDQILLGGGVSKKYQQYKNYINGSLNVAPATLYNDAGIIGAALHAQELYTDNLY